MASRGKKFLIGCGIGCGALILVAIVVMISSRWSSALRIPSRMWARSSAFFRSKRERRTTIVLRWSRKCPSRA